MGGEILDGVTPFSDGTDRFRVAKAVSHLLRDPLRATDCSGDVRGRERLREFIGEQRPEIGCICDLEYVFHFDETALDDDPTSSPPGLGRIMFAIFVFGRQRQVDLEAWVRDESRDSDEFREHVERAPSLRRSSPTENRAIGIDPNNGFPHRDRVNDSDVVPGVE